MAACTAATGCRHNSGSRKPTAAAASTAPAIIITDDSESVPDTIRLGRMRAGECVVRSVAVENGLDSPLVISDVDSDCGCIVPEYDRSPIQPGGRTSLSVLFDSGGYRGYILKQVRIATTASDRPALFFIEAQVE